MPRKTFMFEGKRYDITATTDEELYTKIANKKRDLEERKVKESNILVKEYSKIWYETYKEPFVEKKTQETYTVARKCINSYIGSMRMKDVLTSDIQQIINSEFAKGKSKSHIDKLALTLRQIFKQARIDKKIIENPAENIIKPKMKQGVGRALTDKERKAVLEVAKTQAHGKWVRCMLYMGLRPEETSLLQGKDVDLKNKMLHVRGTKTDKANRYVPIPGVIIDDFRDFKPEQYIFTTETGTRLSENRIKRWWHSFKRDLDIYMGAEVKRNKITKSVLPNDLRLYCLRHTYGTDGQAAGVPIDVISDNMGHEDISTTKKYYIHENKESKNRARKSYEKYYQKRDKK